MKKVQDGSWRIQVHMWDDGPERVEAAVASVGGRRLRAIRDPAIFVLGCRRACARPGFGCVVSTPAVEGIESSRGRWKSHERQNFNFIRFLTIYGRGGSDRLG